QRLLGGVVDGDIAFLAGGHGELLGLRQALVEGLWRLSRPAAQLGRGGSGPGRQPAHGGTGPEQDGGFRHHSRSFHGYVGRTADPAAPWSYREPPARTQPASRASMAARAASALEPSGPPAWAMSGRPPPPLPPRA